jgi:8-oxo-dGTP pyrophosphatase MutT (NUDIX family)
LSGGWRTLRRGTEHDYTILRIREDQVEDPHGRAHPRVRIDCPDWVTVVALTTTGDAVMVRQYRAGIDAETLEIPGGIVDPGETPEAAARRELAEETGFRAGRWELLGVSHPNPALQSNRHHAFLALDCERVDAPRLDVGEDIRVELIPRARLPELVRTRAITHALVLVSLYLVGVPPPSPEAAR